MFQFFSYKIPMALAVLAMVATVGFAYTAGATDNPDAFQFLRVEGGTLNGKFQVVPKNAELPSPGYEQDGGILWSDDIDHENKIFRAFGNASLDALGVFGDAIFRLKKDGQEVQSSDPDVVIFDDYVQLNPTPEKYPFVTVGYAPGIMRPGVHNLEVNEKIRIASLDKNDPNWPDEYVCADDYGRFRRCGFNPTSPTENPVGVADPCNDLTTVVDSRDGTVYDLVSIGNQCWFQENLDIGIPVPVKVVGGIISPSESFYETSSDLDLFPFGDTIDNSCQIANGLEYYCEPNLSEGDIPYCRNASGITDHSCENASYYEQTNYPFDGSWTVDVEGTDIQRDSATEFCRVHTEDETSYCNHSTNTCRSCSVMGDEGCYPGNETDYGVACSYYDNTLLKGCYAHSSGNQDLDCSQNGGLYTLQQHLDSEGLCPAGWRVPTDADWQELETFLGMSSIEVSTFAQRNTGNVGQQLRQTGLDDFQALTFWSTATEDITHFMTSTVSGGAAIKRVVGETSNGVGRYQISDAQYFSLDVPSKTFASRITNFLSPEKAKATSGLRDLTSVRCIMGAESAASGPTINLDPIPADTYSWVTGAWGACGSGQAASCDGSWTATTSSCDGGYVESPGGFPCGPDQGGVGFCNGLITYSACSANIPQCAWSGPNCSDYTDQTSCGTYGDCTWNTPTTTHYCAGPTDQSSCESQNAACSFSPIDPSEKTRSVWCEDSLGDTVADSFCESASEPSDNSTEGCIYQTVTPVDLSCGLLSDGEIYNVQVHGDSGEVVDYVVSAERGNADTTAGVTIDGSYVVTNGSSTGQFTLGVDGNSDMIRVEACGGVEIVSGDAFSSASFQAVSPRVLADVSADGSGAMVGSCSYTSVPIITPILCQPDISQPGPYFCAGLATHSACSANSNCMWTGPVCTSFGNQPACGLNSECIWS